MVETINKLARVQRQLHQELGREASACEIAAEMGLELERVAEIQRIAQEPVSLQSPIGEEESDLGDFIEDADAVVPMEAAAFIMCRTSWSGSWISWPGMSSGSSSCGSASPTGIRGRWRKSAGSSA